MTSCNHAMGCRIGEHDASTTPKAGLTNLLLCLDASNTVSQLNRYLQCKVEAPTRTDAYLICPRMSNAPWLP